jgi:hypothetical protein
VYLRALLLTLAVEVPLYAVALRGMWRVRWPVAVALGAGVNLLTHPVLWSVLWRLRAWPAYPWMLLVLEVAAVAAEWSLLWTALGRARRRDPWLLATVVAGVNAASVLAGLLIDGAAAATPR